MKTAADRVLAESWIGEKISGEVTDAAIEKAYKTFVADTASREQVTAAHILVATEDEAKTIIAFAQEERILPNWRKQINRTKWAKWWLTWQIWSRTNGPSL